MKDLISPEQEREMILKSAKIEMANLKAMKLIIEADNDCEAKLIINGKLYHSFSCSSIFIKTINLEIKEIQKAIKGLPNIWE